VTSIAARSASTPDAGQALPRLTVVSVLYGHSSVDIDRLIRSLTVAADACDTAEVSIYLGNCGEPYPSNFEERLRSLFTRVHVLEFGSNLGHSGGCNAVVSRLQDISPQDLLLFLNPDALLAPSAIPPLVADLAQTDVGATDGRQIPFEHPKAFDGASRVQSWASGACLATRVAVFQEVGGFDPVHFWSYCNDVDLSWRIRLAGWKILHTPDAVVFHDKRMDRDGRIEPTETETYYSTVGRLNLARRYGDPSVERSTLTWIDGHGSLSHRRAARDFRALRATAQSPEPIPGARRVAQFVDGEYGARRF
jgi:GT2 family glycosyltransferase